MKEKVTVSEINEMNYAEFIAFSNQLNTPAGAIRTIDSWIYHSGICEKSFVLDVGCSTGFSSREVSQKTGCAVIGIDLCEKAIEGAREILVQEDRPLAIRYEVGDINESQYREKQFSHIILGSSLGFIRDKKDAIHLLSGLLQDGGYLLMAPFWFKNEPPQEIQNDFTKEVGFCPQVKWGRNEWLDLLDNDEIMLSYEQRYQLNQEPEESIRKHCERTVIRCEMAHGGLTEDVKRACFERLFHIRKVINAIRPYQECGCWIFKKNQYGHSICKY